MYQTVLKIDLDHSHKQKINLYGEAVRVLSVGTRGNCLAMWVEVIGFIDVSQSIPVTVYVVQNDETYDDMGGSQYIGTVQVDEHDYHIYVSETLPRR